MIRLNFPNPVTDEKDFYGRKRREALEQAERNFRAEHSLSMVVVGERRVGKTSQLKVLLQRLEKLSAHRYVPLCIEPRGITSLDDLALSILQRLAVHSGRNLSEVGVSRKQGFHLDTLGQFEQMFASLLGNVETGERFILCVDEFDEILRRVRSRSDAELLRLLGLMNLLTERTTLPLVLLLSMRLVPHRE